jgi:hypothetical protein
MGGLLLDNWLGLVSPKGPSLLPWPLGGILQAPSQGYTLPEGYTLSGRRDRGKVTSEQLLAFLRPLAGDPFLTLIQGKAHHLMTKTTRLLDSLRIRPYREIIGLHRPPLLQPRAVLHTEIGAGLGGSYLP